MRSEKVISFCVPGKPVGKERPRFDGHHAYTPKKTRDYEKTVQSYFAASARGATLSGPVCADITVLRKIPDSYTKKQKEELANAPCETKPDCDNVAKAILDALNGIAYKDDACVTHVVVDKRWTSNRDAVIVALYEWR